jgi:hypothetical protein
MDDCSEDFDPLFEFHTELETINKKHGTGRIVAVVWNTEPQKHGRHNGMAILQVGMGMTARRFSVEFTKTSYMLRYMGINRQVTSDYFA